MYVCQPLQQEPFPFHKQSPPKRTLQSQEHLQAILKSCTRLLETQRKPKKPFGPLTCLSVGLVVCPRVPPGLPGSLLWFPFSFSCVLVTGSPNSPAEAGLGPPTTWLVHSEDISYQHGTLKPRGLNQVFPHNNDINYAFNTFYWFFFFLTSCHICANNIQKIYGFLP